MKVVAHRGSAGLRVENTLAAFANAIDLGADSAELNVHLTRDCCVVVHHYQDSTARIAGISQAPGCSVGGEHAIPDLAAADLRDYEIGVPVFVAEFGV